MFGMFICLVMAAINVPFVLQGEVINMFSFAFCMIGAGFCYGISRS